MLDLTEALYRLTVWLHEASLAEHIIQRCEGGEATPRGHTRGISSGCGRGDTPECRVNDDGHAQVVEGEECQAVIPYNKIALPRTNRQQATSSTATNPMISVLETFFFLDTWATGIGWAADGFCTTWLTT
jgi:hypothetical protein